MNQSRFSGYFGPGYFGLHDVVYIRRTLYSKGYTYTYVKAGKEEAIKTHKGFQSLNIAEIPSFQQHEANQRAISKVAYREDWDEEKGKKRFYAV